jgi:hypothetical protein
METARSYVDFEATKNFPASAELKGWGNSRSQAISTSSGDTASEGPGFYLRTVRPLCLAEQIKIAPVSPAAGKH